MRCPESNAAEKQMSASRTCRRCGSCCTRHAPTLHHGDEALYRQGLVRKEHLVTMRRGEWVYDNVRDVLMLLDTEMIRVRHGHEHKGCLFLDHDRAACSVYEHRPLECRAMKCWDLRDILDLYPRDRLTRWDLVPAESALGQIMADHESQCGYDRVASICDRLQEHDDRELVGELGDMVKADQSFRSALQERAGADEHTLNFIFGRPLPQTLPLFGFRAELGEHGAVTFRPESMSRSRLLRVEQLRRSAM